MYRKARAKALLRQAQNELASGVVDKDEVKSEGPVKESKGSEPKRKRRAKKASKSKAKPRKKREAKKASKAKKTKAD